MTSEAVRVRFQTDEDFNEDIVAGLLRLRPGMDILTAKQASLLGSPDPLFLAHAAGQGRVLVSHDKKTMPRHFYDFLLGGNESPGLILLDQRLPKVQAIDALLLVWEASSPDEYRNLTTYLPF